MAAVNGGVPGEGASDREDPLGLAMQHMAQALAQLQAAVRQQEDRRRQTLTQDERMQEAMAQVGLNKVAIRALIDRVRKMEERVAAVEARGGVSQQQPLELLERRMGSLETSIQRALESVFPRVEALVAQLEKSSSTASPVFSSSSAAAPKSTSTPGLLHASTNVIGDPRVTLEIPQDLGRDLWEALKKERVLDVERLLDRGVDVNWRSRLDWTPLMFAASLGHKRMLKLLLHRGAYTELTLDDQTTALHCTTHLNSSMTICCVKLLVNAGADMNSTDERGNTPLHEAVRRGNGPAVRALLACGASRTVINNDNESPIDLAQTRAMRRLFYL